MKFEQNLNSTLTEEKSKLIKEKSEISENYQKLQKEFEIIKSNLEIQKTSLKSKDQEKPLELTNQFDILKKRAISFKLTDIKESEKLKDCNFDRAQTEFIPLDVSPKKSYYETPILTENSEKEANISFTTLENIKKYNCESSNSSQRGCFLQFY